MVLSSLPKYFNDVIADHQPVRFTRVSDAITLGSDFRDQFFFNLGNVVLTTSSLSFGMLYPLIFVMRVILLLLNIN